jgi:hypothetical protein
MGVPSSQCLTRARRKRDSRRDGNNNGGMKMEIYTLGFKSGALVNFETPDGKAFINDVISGINKNPSAPVQIHTGPGFLFVVSELEFILPTSSIKKD